MTVTPELERRHILIVDDEQTLTFFIRQSLLRESPAYVVDTAVSAEEALTKIEGHPYDMIVVDLRLPGMNGLELIAQLQDQLPQAYTVLMTSYGSEAVEEEARRLQVFRYLTKPFRLQELAATVQEAFAGRTHRPAAQKSSEKDHCRLATPSRTIPSRPNDVTEPTARGRQQ